MNEKQIKFLIELREESKRLDEIFDRIEKHFKALSGEKFSPRNKKEEERLQEILNSNASLSDNFEQIDWNESKKLGNKLFNKDNK